MPALDAIPPYSSLRHQWHMRFDRLVCRNCGNEEGDDDHVRCTGARRMRPIATFRQHEQEGRACWI
jgi:hypothetical protein